MEPKFGEDRTCAVVPEICSRTDKQDRQTDTLISIIRSPIWGGVILEAVTGGRRFAKQRQSKNTQADRYQRRHHVRLSVLSLLISTTISVCCCFVSGSRCRSSAKHTFKTRGSRGPQTASLRCHLESCFTRTKSNPVRSLACN